MSLLKVFKFIRDSNGNMGQVEESGKVNVWDYVLGVNNVNFIERGAPKMSFEEAVNCIIHTTNPKTLKFAREIKQVRCFYYSIINKYIKKNLQ